MGNNKKIAINIISQIISFLVGAGISFLLTPLITKELGTEVYGFVGMAYQVLSYISIFTIAFSSMHNIFTATEYHKSNLLKANEYFSSISILNSVLTILLILPLVLIVLNLEKFINVPTDTLIDIKLLWTFIFITFLINLVGSTYGVGVYIKNRLDLAARRTLQSNIAKGILMFICYWFLTPKVWYIGAVSFVCGVFCIVMNYYYLKKLTPELKIRRSYFKIKAVKEVFFLGIWNSLSSLTYVLNNGLDLLISNLFIGALGMGYMSFAQTFPQQFYILFAVVFGSFNPLINYAFAKGNMKDFIKEIHKAIKIGGFICSVPVWGFIIFGGDFFSLWLPTLNSNEINIIHILSILIFMNAIIDMYINPVYSVASIVKKIRIPVVVSFGISILNIIIELILLKYTNLGIYAIEIPTAILLSLKAIIFTPIYSARIIHEKWYVFYKPLIRGGLATIIGLMFFYVLKRLMLIQSWSDLLLVALVGGIIGYIINYIVLLDKDERIFIQNKITHILHINVK